MTSTKRTMVLLATTAALTAAACDRGPSASAALTITAPAAAAEVTSPVTFDITATDITIEPAGEVKAGAGHLHLLIDTPCLAAGTTVPKDATHVHLGDGSTSTSLELPSGEHTVCVQVADGAHSALSVTQTVTFTVS